MQLHGVVLLDNLGILDHLKVLLLDACSLVALAAHNLGGQSYAPVDLVPVLALAAVGAVLVLLGAVREVLLDHVPVCKHLLSSGVAVLHFPLDGGPLLLLSL